MKKTSFWHTPHGIILLVLVVIPFSIYLPISIIKDKQKYRKTELVPKKSVQPTEVNKIKHQVGGGYFCDIEVTGIDFRDTLTIQKTIGQNYDPIGDKVVHGKIMTLHFDMTNSNVSAKSFPIPGGYLTSEYFSDNTGTLFSKSCLCYSANDELTTEEGEKIWKIGQRTGSGEYRIDFKPGETRKFKLEFFFLTPIHIPTVEFRGFTPGENDEMIRESMLTIDTYTGKIMKKSVKER